MVYIYIVFTIVTAIASHINTSMYIHIYSIYHIQRHRFTYKYFKARTECSNPAASLQGFQLCKYMDHIYIYINHIYLCFSGLISDVLIMFKYPLTNKIQFLVKIYIYKYRIYIFITSSAFIFDMLLM